MPLLKTEALKLTNNDLVRGVIEEVLDKEALYALLPFTETQGKAYVYNRENVLATGSWLDPNDTVTEGASSFTEVTTNLRILAGDVDVDKFLAGTMSDHSSQVAIQIAAKVKGMSRQFKQALISGVVANKEFDGIQTLVTAGQTVATATNGSALSFDLLDQLLDTVTLGADCIFMRQGTIRAYRALLRAAGGNDGMLMQLENFGKPVLHHNGVPILPMDFIPGNIAKGSTPNTCSVYAVRFNESDGLHGLFGGGPAGFVVEDIGTVQNKDAWRFRVKWYVGLALKSTKSIARIEGITNV